MRVSLNNLSINVMVIGSSQILLCLLATCSRYALYAMFSVSDELEGCCQGKLGYEATSIIRK